MVKTITVRDATYERLLALKRPGESFSDLIERLISSAGPRELLVKLRGCVELEDKEALLAEIARARGGRRP